MPRHTLYKRVVKLPTPRREYRGRKWLQDIHKDFSGIDIDEYHRKDWWKVMIRSTLRVTFSKQLKASLKSDNPGTGDEQQLHCNYDL